MQVNSIPEATNRDPNPLIVVVPVDIANGANQAAVPGIGCTALHRTPPTTVVANVGECSIVVTVTARKT